MPEETILDYFELEKLGIKRVQDLGKNAWGFREKVVHMNDGSIWDYMPEDQYYEKRVNRTHDDLYPQDLDLRYVSHEVGYVDRDEEYY